MAEVPAPAAPVPTPSRPRTVSIVGWFFFGISCWMILGSAVPLSSNWLRGVSSEVRGPISSAILFKIAAAELFLGPFMLVASCRFLNLRKWTRLPLALFALALIVGTAAFALFWLFKSKEFFAETEDGPPLKGIELAFVTGVQIATMAGGVLACALFCVGFGLLLKQLGSRVVRDSVNRGGF
jgi:hypothetical protein